MFFAPAASSHTEKLDIPNTENWQLADYVWFLNPYAERIKKNHGRWRKASDPAEKERLKQQNQLLLCFLSGVLNTIPKQRHEAVVVSDSHFGLKYASDLELLVFLHSINPEYLFANGDITDDMVMKSRYDINPIQRLALRRGREMHKSGECQVVRLGGNHDPRHQRWAPGKKGYGGIPIYRDVIYIGADGSRSLITHGDRFDKIVGSKGKLEHWGGRAYDKLVVLNHYHKKASRAAGIPHLSIARTLKVGCKLICMRMSHFDDLVFAMAEQCQADYVLCGHTHIHLHLKRGNVEYINSADWVETCAALVKPAQGRWQLVRPMQRKEHPGYVFPRQERPVIRSISITLPPQVMAAFNPTTLRPRMAMAQVRVMEMAR